jgi:sugar lactone lactonase YvrE
MVIDEAFVYWFNANDGGIYRSARDGNSAATLLVSPANTTQLAVDDSNLYWTTTAAGSVSKVSKTARGLTMPTMIANNQMAPIGIAVDANAIYFGTTVPAPGGGVTVIQKLAK